MTGEVPHDVVTLHEGALAATGRVIAALRPHHLSLPTPCAGWDVRRLVTHLIEGNEMFTRAVSGETSDHSGGDLLRTYGRSVEALRRAWSRAGVLDQEAVLPFGTFPAPVALRMHFVDHLVHGWDLAKATGQETTLDEHLAAAAYEEMAQALEGAPRGPGMPFGPAEPCPVDAPVHERLVALLGRRP